MALAEKIQGTGAITVVFMGDGTMGEGVIYEAFNMASLWKIPILFVIENNRMAQTTPVHLAVAGKLSARLKAFGIPATKLDSSDVKEIHSAAGEMADQVRSHQSPAGLILNTYRFGPHSKGDDTRPPDEIARMRKERDPLAIQCKRLDAQKRHEIEISIDKTIAGAYQQAMTDPFPT